MYAMVHLAVSDALNAIDRRYRPYAMDVHALAGSAPDAAVAAAAHGVLVPLIQQIPAPFPASCLAAGVATVEQAYARAVHALPDSPATRKGLALGRAAAAVVLAVRAEDGSDTPLIDTAFPQGVAAGEYRFTPGTPFAFAEGWGGVTPFALRSAAQYRPRPPYSVTSRRYAADYAEIAALGGDGVTTPSARTPDQTQIALFWVESSPLAWNRLARSVVMQKGLDLWQSARLYALLDVALADGYISSFDTKYFYRFWRPVTGIHLGGSDGNPATRGDPTWTPLRTTPAIPDYDSAHAVEGAAAAAVIAEVVGSDRVRVTACSRTLDPGSRCGEPGEITRTYGSLSQAAAENGLSRILVGFHFRSAVEQGLARGAKVGHRAVSKLLRPAHS
jgi:hypothetical protein